ncbi:SRPBCC family protein [Nocardia paucivorans]|uniref:SRPBCC family protein n=1 Tax=Nocardia paucivorans TaxID=114259 RepID=UPI0005948592|nr:SRPBCC family protein [Nocardia paucivorans]
MPAEPKVRIPVPVEDVFAILADGWLYALWVVGATHIREVDREWPNVGARIHHSVGVWPLTRHDVTVVHAVDPPHRLELEARLWPAGSAWITLELVELQPHLTEVRMAERAISGPGRLLPGPLQDLALIPRNNESLARLAALAVGRSRADAG